MSKSRDQKKADRRRTGTKPTNFAAVGTGPKIRIRFVSAHYRDVPGVSVNKISLHHQFVGENGHGFAATLLNALRNYDRWAEERGVRDIVSTCFGQLDEVARHYAPDGALALQDAIIMMMNLNWLVERGHLKSDDANGLQWSYEFVGKDGGRILAISDNNPLSVAPEKLGTGIPVTEEIKAGSVESVRAVGDWVRETWRRPR